MKIINPKNQLLICSAFEASKLAKNYDYVISIADPGSSECYRGKYCTSYNTFHDVSLKFNPNVYVAPSEAHIFSIMSHFRRLYLNNDMSYDEYGTRMHSILIHCAAGVSRSTAVAVLILLLDGYNIDDALNHVFEIRPIARPNPLIISLVDNLLNLNGELIEKTQRKIAYNLAQLYIERNNIQ